MKIRSKNLLVILPIFALLAGVNAWVSITSQKNELRWGQAQQLHSLAVTYAEMSGLAKLEKPVITPQVHTKLERSRSFLKKYSLYKHLTVWQKNGNSWTPVYTTATNKKTVPPEVTVYKGDFFISNPRANQAGEPVKSGWLQLKNSDGQVTGAVQVVIDAQDYFDMISRVRFKALLLLLLSLSVGVGVSWFLSHMITKRLVELGEAAKQLAYEGGRLQVSNSTIREINDLSSTFNTMDSILRETVMRARRSMLDVEQFRGSDGYDAAFQAIVWDTGTVQLERDDEKLALLGYLSGRREAGCFVGYLSEDGGVHRFYYGRISGENGTNTGAASAADSLLQMVVPEQGVQAALKEVSALFPVEHCTVLSWEGGLELKGCSISSGNGGSVTEFSRQLEPDQLLLEGEIDEQTAEMAQPLLALSKGLDYTAFRHDLELLIGHKLRGAVLLLKYSKK